MKNLSVVVCTKNSAHLIVSCLSNLKKELPGCEIIVIDADSPDKTAKLAKKITNKVFSDQKRGLSYARQLGIDKSNREYVAFFGPDDAVSTQTVIDMLAVLKNKPIIAGVQALTKIIQPKNYWEEATKYIFDYILNKLGSVDVLGTPCIYRREVVARIKYDESIRGGCDDTDLSLRLKQAGYSLEKINSFSYEEQDLNFWSFFNRWKFYGTGDAEFYRKYSSSWTRGRKLKSLLHPFNKYIFNALPLFVTKGRWNLIPALIVATYARYYGWIVREKSIRQGN